jgi:2-keto-3-deoxy-L-fuconate dehydrogenase
MTQKFADKTVLVTQIDRYMGEPMAAAFSAAGAEVITDADRLDTQQAIDDLVQRAGDVDILIANFADDPMPSAFGSITDETLESLYASIVFPFIKTVRSVGASMQARGAGKIIAITSAAPLRGLPGYAAYCSARGAQNAFVRTVGLELAAHNVQFNAIAQNFVKNERYFPDEFIQSEEFARDWMPLIPTQNVADPEETCELALYLASEKCTHMVGQVIPWAGGWVTTTG